MNEQVWFADGLKFSCTGCGNCCTGAPGYVWVNGEEIAALARRLEMSKEEFEKQFVRAVGIRKSLVEFENGDCVFFDGEKRNCTVYEDRPRQCRTWPFWESNVRSPKAWKETCENCPGAGKGKHFPAEHVLHQLAVIKL